MRDPRRLPDLRASKPDPAPIRSPGLRDQVAVVIVRNYKRRLKDDG